MKIPIPPTGGQGGHYSFGSTARTRIYKYDTDSDERIRVPRRFRGLRLRKRTRTRMSREHPMMLVFVGGVLALVFFLAAQAVIDLLA